MNKPLLIWVSAMLAAALIVGCTQVTEFDGSSLKINSFGVEAPRNVKAEAYMGAVRITWNAPKSSVTGYRVFRKLKGSSDAPALIGTTSGTTTVYADTKITGDNRLVSGTYLYQVVAYLDAGSFGTGSTTAESAQKEVSVTVPEPGSIVPLPKTPVLVVASSYPTNSATTTNFNYTLKVSGLDPAYVYTYTIQRNDNPGNNPNNWWDDSNGALSIKVLDSADFDGVAYVKIPNLVKSPATRMWRLVAEVTLAPAGNLSGGGFSIDNKTINNPPDSYFNASNKILIGTF